jgi:hypothetical protein
MLRAMAPLAIQSGVVRPASLSNPKTLSTIARLPFDIDSGFSA